MNNSADQNIEQNPQQTQAEQKTSWVKSKTTRRTALIGGLGLLGTAGLGTGWAYNRYLRDHTEIADVAAYTAEVKLGSGQGTRPGAERQGAAAKGASDREPVGHAALPAA
ncbi:hypothetical protein [Rothia nasimurium]|uniref:hypothetical protein n=1 Tax=Rothia nasimurium TaxID=85336 RepID=UPI001F2EB1D1|nr:hypothetical protein [Rothia nasimurium]